MRKQVIEVFEDWIAFWSERNKDFQSWRSAMQLWLGLYFPDIKPEIAEAVADCFAKKPDAYASWEVCEDNTFNVIIHPINKQQKSLNNE